MSLHAQLQHRLDQANTRPDFIIHYLVLLWGNIQALLLLLFYCRWSILVLVIGGGLMLLSDQGHEIAIRTGDGWGFSIFAFLGTAFWALHSWLSARLILMKIYPKRGKNRGAHFEQLVNEFPRLIGLTAFFLTFIAFFMAWSKLGFPLRGNGLVFLLVLDIAFGYGFYYLVKNRRRLMEKYLHCDNDKENIDWLLKIITPVTILYSLGFFLWATVGPVSFGFSLFGPDHRQYALS